MNNTNPNLGQFFYKDLYEVAMDKQNKRYLKINEQKKKELLSINSLASISPLNNPTFSLVTTYPGLTTGTGYPHGIKGTDEDFKIGCHFDYTLGYPIIPASSVKGTLRSAFPDFKDDKLSFKNRELDTVKAKWIIALCDHIGREGFFDRHINPIDRDLVDQDIKKVGEIVYEIFEGISAADGNPLSIYNRDIFHDAIPVKSMHTGGRYFGTDSITPHIKEGKTYAQSQLLNPTPLLFFKVLPNVQFDFHFKLNDGKHLTKEEKEKLFKKIILTTGIGAKTNVGYGQFVELNNSIKPNNTSIKEVKTKINEGISIDNVKVNDVLDAIIDSLSGGLVIDLQIQDFPYKQRLLGVSTSPFEEGQLIKVKVTQIGKRMKFEIINKE